MGEGMNKHLEELLAITQELETINVFSDEEKTREWIKRAQNWVAMDIALETCRDTKDIGWTGSYNEVQHNVRTPMVFLGD